MSPLEEPHTPSLAGPPHPAAAADVDFRRLVSRLLPLEMLGAPRGRRRPRELATRLGAPIQQAGRLALAELERPGASARADAGPGVAAAERPLEAGGIQAFPRSRLPSGAQARIERIRGLVRFTDPLLDVDAPQGHEREGLIQRLSQAGREVFSGSDVRFIAVASELSPAPHPVPETALARQALAAPGILYYCPDLARAPELASEAGRAGTRSLVAVGVAARDGTPLGLLEISNPARDPFGPEDLTLAALLADCCAGALERAARIERLMFIDPLTSAFNRSYFDQQLQNEMARAQREQSPMALCIADIDDFKSFNTRFGYYAGNQVLVQVAQVLKSGVRPFDSVARWGGEEFAVLLTAPVQPQDVVTVSERLRSLVERQQVWIRTLEGHSQRVKVTVSIGVASFPDHGKDAAELWRSANQALLEAKQPPKNRVVFFAAGRRPEAP